MFRAKVNKINISIMIIFILLSLCSLRVAAISVSEIINNMQNTYKKQMAGINDYTVIQKPSGGMAAMVGEIKNYYKKAVVEGEETFLARTESQVMGMSIISIYDGKYSWTANPLTGKPEKKIAEGSPALFWKNIDSAQTKYLGEEMIDGEKTYVLQIENAFQVLGSQPAAASPQQGEKPADATGKLWVSSKTWMPLRMQLTIKGVSDDEEMVMNMVNTTDLKDYRQVGTMLHPFQLITSTSTEIDTSGMSAEEKEEQEQAMKMMQSMMSGMGSFTIETADITVNTGLSDDLFDGTKLK